MDASDAAMSEKSEVPMDPEDESDQAQVSVSVGFFLFFFCHFIHLMWMRLVCSIT